MKNKTDERFRGYPIISDQISKEGLGVVCSHLEEVIRRGVPGDVVEFGCYIGTTSLFIRRILDSAGQSSERQFHVYDSFEGLPEKSVHDSSPAGAEFKAGELSVAKKEFLQQFRAANLKTPFIHKCWFDQLPANEVPDQIAFAFLDGDFYSSIISSLRLAHPRMAKGGKILIDDYKREALPGVEKAVSDFLGGKTTSIRHQHNIAVIDI